MEGGCRKQKWWKAKQGRLLSALKVLDTTVSRMRDHKMPLAVLMAANNSSRAVYELLRAKVTLVPFTLLSFFFLCGVARQPMSLNVSNQVSVTVHELPNCCDFSFGSSRLAERFQTIIMFRQGCRWECFMVTDEDTAVKCTDSVQGNSCWSPPPTRINWTWFVWHDQLATLQSSSKNDNFGQNSKYCLKYLKKLEKMCRFQKTMFQNSSCNF